MPLGQALESARDGLAKRERTRRQLLLAAVQVFAARGVGAASILEIANVAGMTTGTVYNHFSSKDDLVLALATWMAETLCERISDSQRSVERGAQRMAIGQRRYAWLARESPGWTLLLLDIAASAPALTERIAAYALEDLRLGIAQDDFRVPDERAAMDLIMGVGTQTMQSIARGHAPPGHDIAMATMVLRGLGMPFARAAQVASRPLPDFGPLDAGPARAGAGTRARREIVESIHPGNKATD